MTPLSNAQPRPRPRPITGRTLAALFKVSREHINNWRRSGELPGQTNGGSNPEYRYEAAAVDALLAKKAVNFTTPPTFDDLQSGRLVLVTAAEASELLRKNERTVRRLVQDGLIAVIELSIGHALRREFRLSLQSVQQHIAASQKTEDLYTLTHVQHVLRLSGPIVSNMTKAGELVVCTLPNHKRKQFVTGESLRQVVQARLPRSTTDTPQAWIDDALADERALYTIPTVMRELGYHIRMLENLLKSGQTCLRYIVNDGRRSRVLLPVSVDAYREIEGPVPNEAIATVFGIDIRDCYRQRHQGSFTCLLGHKDCPLYRGCIVALLDAGLNTHYNGAQWFDLRLQGKLQLVPGYTAAQMLKVRPTKIKQMAEAGVLRGLKLPTGKWRLLAHQFPSATKT